MVLAAGACEGGRLRRRYRAQRAVSHPGTPWFFDIKSVLAMGVPPLAIATLISKNHGVFYIPVSAPRWGPKRHFRRSERSIAGAAGSTRLGRAGGLWAATSTATTATRARPGPRARPCAWASTVLGCNLPTDRPHPPQVHDSARARGAVGAGAGRGGVSCRPHGAADSAPRSSACATASSL